MRAGANALFVRWRATPTLAPLQQILERVQAAAQASGRPIAFVMEIDASVGAPEAEFRRRSVDAVERVGASIACLAVVLRTTGLRAAILRSVITGITMLAKRSFPVRVIPSLHEEARTWVADHVRGSAQARAELREWLRELEASQATEAGAQRNRSRPATPRR